MNECWDLTPLYSGFDDPVFLQDVQQLRAKAEELVAFVPQLEGIEPLEGLRRGTRLLEELAVFALLPVARRADDMTPHYVEGTAYSQEDYSAILLHLERKKLIDIDYGSPVGSYTDPGYAGLKVRGSVALTGRGQAVVEQLHIHGIQP